MLLFFPLMCNEKVFSMQTTHLLVMHHMETCIYNIVDIFYYEPFSFEVMGYPHPGIKELLTSTVRLCLIPSGETNSHGRGRHPTHHRRKGQGINPLCENTSGVFGARTSDLKHGLRIRSNQNQFEFFKLPKSAKLHRNWPNRTQIQLNRPK